MRRAPLVALSSLLLLASMALAPGGASATTAAEPPAAPGELLVGYLAGTSGEARASARSAAAARLIERVVRGSGIRAEVERVRLPKGANRDAAIRRLEADRHVAYAEPNWLVAPAATSDDPYYTSGSLWGMYGDTTSPTNAYGSQAGEAWAGGSTGASSVVVGVIDEGIDVSHPDLAANIWTNPHDPVDGVDNDGNGYVDDVHGWDFHNDDSSVYDGGRHDKHGTHVAGTVAGVGGNGQGVAGVAWSATIVSAKFLGPNGGYTSNAVKAIDYLNDLKSRHGMNVVASNNSWGGGGYSSSLYDAIERANAAGILFVAAAGNGGSDGVGDDNDATPSYPSSYPNANIIAVASITSSGAKSGFSNYGATTVDLGAPGSGIYSTLPGNTYGSYSGTSMATPHVTGGAVLAAASGVSGAATIKAAILDSTAPTASMEGRTVTGGRLNVSGFVGTVIVDPNNTAPAATADAYDATEDTLLTVTKEAGVLANDTDSNGDPLTAKLSSGAANGTVTLASDGSFTYAPNANFAGSDSFSYVANDGAVDSAPATVTLTVAAVDDAPVAAPDGYSTIKDTTLSVSAPGVLGNDFDVDTAALTAVFIDGSVTSGAVVLNEDGSFTFTPAAGFEGQAAFQYRAFDGALHSTATTVTIDVTATATAASSALIDYSWFGGKHSNSHLDVTVVVTDDKGAAVAGAVVTADVNGVSRVATTDSSGVAALVSYRGVPSGFCALTDITAIDANPAWSGAVSPHDGYQECQPASGAGGKNGSWPTRMI